jgi:hypothetical protein
MSLVPVPSEQPSATCANCGSQLAADQRYCLECGQPTSPVRLAFLDVLESEQKRPSLEQGLAAAAALDLASFAPAYGPPGARGWLRRNTGLLALLGVLVLCLIAGLLVGHWASQGSKPAAASTGPQVIKIEGLGALAGAGTATSPSSSTGAATSTTASSAKEEAEASKEAAKETKAEKAPPPAPKKVGSSELEKLSKSSGKKHQEEIEANGAAPIETG